MTNNNITPEEYISEIQKLKTHVLPLLKESGKTIYMIDPINGEKVEINYQSAKEMLEEMEKVHFACRQMDLNPNITEH